MSTMNTSMFTPCADASLSVTVAIPMVDLTHLMQMPVQVDQQKIDRDKGYIPPAVEPRPIAVLDINAMRWTNCNNIFVLFHPVDVLGLFFEVVWRSLGKQQYQYSILHDWVECMLGYGDYFDPETGLPEPSAEEVSYVQDSVFREFCNWTVNNQAFITQVLQPLLTSGLDVYNLKQQRTTNSIVFHAG